MSPDQYKQELSDKVSVLKSYLDRFKSLIEDSDSALEIQQNMNAIDNFTLMIQGQTEFVKQQLKLMDEECK